MKKIYCVFAILILSLGIFFAGCSPYDAKNLASDLDTSITNFVGSISKLDWPDDDSLNKLDSIAELERNFDTIDDVQKVADTEIDTSELYTWIDRIKNEINILYSKKADVYLYIDEINSNNTSLSESDIQSIKVYINVIKDNSNYLNRYSGMLNTQIGEAISIIDSQNNLNLINAYVIRAVETLEIRSAKIDTTILALNSIIDIISKNLINNHFNQNKYTLTKPEEKIEEEHEIDNTQQDDDAITEEEIEKDIKDENIGENEYQEQTDQDQIEIDIDDNNFGGETVEVEKKINENFDENPQEENIEREEKELLKEDTEEKQVPNEPNNKELDDNLEVIAPSEKPITREIFKEKVV